MYSNLQEAILDQFNLRGFQSFSSTLYNFYTNGLFHRAVSLSVGIFKDRVSAVLEGLGGWMAGLGLA